MDLGWYVWKVLPTFEPVMTGKGAFEAPFLFLHVIEQRVDGLIECTA